MRLAGTLRADLPRTLCHIVHRGWIPKRRPSDKERRKLHDKSERERVQASQLEFDFKPADSNDAISEEVKRREITDLIYDRAEIGYTLENEKQAKEVHATNRFRRTGGPSFRHSHDVAWNIIRTVQSMTGNKKYNPLVDYLHNAGYEVGEIRTDIETKPILYVPLELLNLGIIHDQIEDNISIKRKEEELKTIDRLEEIFSKTDDRTVDEIFAELTRYESFLLTDISNDDEGLTRTALTEYITRLKEKTKKDFSRLRDGLFKDRRVKISEYIDSLDDAEAKRKLRAVDARVERGLRYITRTTEARDYLQEGHYYFQIKHEDISEVLLRSLVKVCDRITNVRDRESIYSVEKRKVERQKRKLGPLYQEPEELDSEQIKRLFDERPDLAREYGPQAHLLEGLRAGGDERKTFRDDDFKGEDITLGEKIYSAAKSLIVLNAVNKLLANKKVNRLLVDEHNEKYDRTSGNVPGLNFGEYNAEQLYFANALVVAKRRLMDETIAMISEVDTELRRYAKELDNSIEECRKKELRGDLEAITKRVYGITPTEKRELTDIKRKIKRNFEDLTVDETRKLEAEKARVKDTECEKLREYTNALQEFADHFKRRRKQIKEWINYKIERLIEGKKSVLEERSTTRVTVDVKDMFKKANLSPEDEIYIKRELRKIHSRIYVSPEKEFEERMAQYDKELNKYEKKFSGNERKWLAYEIEQELIRTRRQKPTTDRKGKKIPGYYEKTTDHGPLSEWTDKDAMTKQYGINPTKIRLYDDNNQRIELSDDQFESVCKALFGFKEVMNNYFKGVERGLLKIPLMTIQGLNDKIRVAKYDNGVN